MDKLFEFTTIPVWFAPFAIIAIFIRLEEKARKEGLLDKLDSIETTIVRHDRTGQPAQPNVSVCETTLHTLVNTDRNKRLFELYFVRYPRVVECLSCLQKRRITLYIAAAIVLFMALFIFQNVPDAAVSADSKKTVQKALSGASGVTVIVVALRLWYRRFLPVRTFCDELDRIRRT